MSVNLHSGRLLTDAVIHALESAGLKVGDNVAPPGVGWVGVPGASSFTGYVVVYGLTGGVLDGPIGAPDDDASTIVQLTSVGADRRQCMWVADKARGVMLTTPLQIIGRTVSRVAVDMLGGTVRDDDVQPSVTFSPDRYRIWTTPT
jgi:hypothetical protein